MNGNIKFHKPSSPAFNNGEVWVGASGSKVVIDGITHWPVCVGKYDYTVHYTQCNGTKTSKGAWEFQVRYTHQADEKMRSK